MSSPAGGGPPRGDAEKQLGEIVGEVSAKASLLVREEIELAKAELVDKAGKFGRGAAAGVAAGVFGFFALIFFLHALAWFFNEVAGLPVWGGYLLVTLILVVLGALAGFLALRFFRRGSPPKPELAIEEARRTRAVLEEARH